MIYLDNAATSFPKPKPVCDEVTKCLRFYCGNPGRGAHKLSLAAAEKIFECREEAASFFGCDKPENIVFTLNTTESLNMMIKGLLHKGDHVIISDLEHNSVWRPVSHLATEGIEYDIFPSMVGNPRRNAVRICAGLARLIKKNTKLVICIHSSNICSASMPIKEIGAFCHRHKILFAVDVAQSAGHMPINMQEMNIDVLCAPGHKGLLGPAGCGILALGKDITLDTLIEGGNGVNSLEANMPDFSPERYEAGTLPVPAIAGLCEGIKTVKQVGLKSIMEHERTLYTELYERLKSLERVKIYASEYPGAVMLFGIDKIPSDEIARELDARDICVRSGFHCSPLAHRTLQTPEDGAVRASFSVYNTKNDIDALYTEIERLAK